MKYILVSAILFAGVVLSCEREISPGQADRFIKFYGSYLMDEARDMAVLEDGGYAICGVDSIPDLGRRMVLILTDQYGNPKNGFPKYYTEEGLQSAANAIVPIRGGQGGFMLAGYVERPVEGSFNVQKDIFVVKVSSSGAINWQNSFGSSADEVVLSACDRNSSGFMLAGYKLKDGNSDLMIMAVDQDGDSIQIGLFRNPTITKKVSAEYIIGDDDDKYLCVVTNDKIGGNGTTDIWVFYLDEELTYNPYRLSDNSDETGTCIVEQSPGTYLVTGNRTIGGKKEVVTYQITTAGGAITTKQLLTTISESKADLVGNRAVTTEDGRFAIVGTRQSEGERDIFLQFMTPDYEPTDRILFGTTGDQSGADIGLADDGGLILLGTAGNGENSMITLIKTDDTGDL
jgi:hypothetical protein